MLKIIDLSYGTVKNDEGVIPVSYTHLDVYKRQVNVWHTQCAKSDFPNKY